MGAIPALLGIGNTGLNFKPEGARIDEAANLAQAQQAYQQSQAGIQQQQQFLNALAAQGGIQNQSDVYNQLQQVASGQGPNPAQAMLNQATGNNIASQAALMAGQRGAASNAGLLARQIAQQGGNIQQQAAGQGAVLQANQSLGALNQLGGLATQQVGQQQQGLNALNQASQAEQNLLLKQIADQNQQRVAMQSNVNDVQGKIQQQAAQGQQNLLSNLTGGASAALTKFVGLAEGGEVPNPNGPRSKVGMHFANMAKGGVVKAMVSPGELYLDPMKVEQFKANPQAAIQSAEQIPGQAKVKGDSLKNDTVPKDLEEGGVVVPRTKAKGVKESVDFVASVINKKRGKK